MSANWGVRALRSSSRNRLCDKSSAPVPCSGVPGGSGRGSGSGRVRIRLTFCQLLAGDFPAFVTGPPWGNRHTRHGNRTQNSRTRSKHTDHLPQSLAWWEGPRRGDSKPRLRTRTHTYIRIRIDNFGQARVPKLVGQNQVSWGCLGSNMTGKTMLQPHQGLWY